MTKEAPIAVLGTFDSKGEEHQFLRTRIQERGCRAVTINVGTKRPPSHAIDIDLYREMAELEKKRPFQGSGHPGSDIKGKNLDSAPL